MKILVETLAGIAILVGMLFAVDCLPKKDVQRPHVLGDAGIPTCTVEATPALLCNAVTKTSPPRECTICVERACLTSTGLYCSTSCDEPLCEHRK